MSFKFQRENHHERNKTEKAFSPMMPKQKGINFNWKHQTVAKKQEKQARLIVTPEIHTKKDNFGIEIKNMVKTDKFYA